MPEYRRPSLLTADQVEVSEHLLTKGIASSTRKDDTAMLIDIPGTSEQLTAALADYVPGAAIEAERLKDVEASGVFADFTPAQLTKIRDVYGGGSTFTVAQRDKLLAGLALLVHRRLR